MSSGNPCGLSEISHFGTFQRVGGKAGGFISKKFFHPSSFRNQEKLWKAQTADERQRRKQLELEKRREEERQVEELRKQMYLSGQGKAGDFLSSTAQDSVEQDLGDGEKDEQRRAFEELRRRKALLKQEHREKQKEAAAAAAAVAGDADAEVAAEVVTHASSSKASSSSAGILAKSRYKEDVHRNGHTSVWGSWYTTEEQRWGFACCKLKDPVAPCPLAASDEAGELQAASKEEPRAKRRRRGDGGADGAAAEPAGLSQPKGRQEQTDVTGGLLSKGGSGGSSSTSSTLMDVRLLQAAERRREKKDQDNTGKDEAKSKTSEYLAGLLQDPTAGA